MKDTILRGKTVVITGASSGVGRALAEAFALEGCNIVAAARGKEGLDEIVATCHDLDVAAMGVPTDMSVMEEVQALAEKALEFNGRIDIWVNNAGVMASGKFEEIPNEINEGVIKTNLFGYMHGAYAALPVFKSQQSGILLNNISIGGYMPAPYSAAYSASKFGIRGLMEGLRTEVSPYKYIHICNMFPQIQRSTGNMHSAKFSGLDFKVPPIAADPRQTAQEFVKVAKCPKDSTFPDATSYMLKTAYGLMPKIIGNTAAAALRLNMKMKKAEPTAGNILEPSDAPKRIYGETSLPVPSKNVKNALMLGIGLGFLWMLADRKK